MLTILSKITWSHCKDVAKFPCGKKSCGEFCVVKWPLTTFGKFDTPYSSYPCTGATEDEMTLYYQLGMISHKMTIITIFGHKHFRQKFHQNF